MGEWKTGAAINVLGSVSINFGTNLLKLGHNQRERLALAEAAETGEKAVLKKPITHFQAWRVGVSTFLLFAQFLSANHIYVNGSTCWVIM
jgi:hypothetical protein